MADPDVVPAPDGALDRPTTRRGAQAAGPFDDDRDEMIGGAAADAIQGTEVVDVRIARPMPTWARVYAGAAGVAAGVTGVVAVFRTDNGVGSAALLLVAVFLVITAVDGQFPRLKIGDNEVMSNLTRAYRQTRGKAERATAEAAVAQVNSDDVRDGLADVQARIAHLERLAGVHGAGPAPGRPDEDDVADRAPGTPPGPPGAPAGTPPERVDDVSFGLDLGGETPRSSERPRIVLSPAALELAERYRSLRVTMPSGPERTRAMTGVVDEMRRSAGDVDVTPLLCSDDVGLRLLAAATLYEHPRPEAVPALAQQVMTDRKPFNEYWSLQALRRGIRGRCDLLTDDVREWLERRVTRVSFDAGRANLIRQILRDCP